MIAGSCLCGDARYELSRQPVLAVNCHCSRCRKARGSAFASNLFVPYDGLTYLAGAEQLRLYAPPDASRFAHVFCGRCGSSMPSATATRGLVAVPMGSLDEDPGFSPQKHIWVQSKAPWHTITDSLPQLADGLVSSSR